MIMMMKTSLDTKGQTVQWHYFFGWYDIQYTESVQFVNQCNLFRCAELLIYYKTR